MAMPASSPPLMTAEEILDLDPPGKSTELVRGHLIVSEPPSTRHGVAAARLSYLIADYVYRNALGVVCGQDTGFHIATNPDTVRAPDVAFVRRERAALIPETGYARLGFTARMGASHSLRLTVCSMGRRRCGASAARWRRCSGSGVQPVRNGATVEGAHDR